LTDVAPPFRRLSWPDWSIIAFLFDVSGVPVKRLLEMAHAWCFHLFIFFAGYITYSGFLTGWATFDTFFVIFLYMYSCWRGIGMHFLFLASQ